MLLKKFEEQELQKAAQEAFPNSFIVIKTSDIFLRETPSGRYKAPWFEREFFVSTDYVYEDKLINGNQTRYKVAMLCVLVKQAEYEVVYDSSNTYYVAYEEDGKILFKKYIDMLDLLSTQLELLEETIPV